MQAAIEEERDRSKLKLILCGSHIGQMQTLLSEDSPLRGRLTPLPTPPLAFPECRPFMPREAAAKRIERFAVAGGMAMYLRSWGGPLRDRICEPCSTRAARFQRPARGPRGGLRRPGAYSRCSKSWRPGVGWTTDAGPADAPLDARPLSQRTDANAARGEGGAGGTARRDLRYRLATTSCASGSASCSPFRRACGRACGRRTTTRRSGARPAEHVAPVFESLCRRWVRRNLGTRRPGLPLVGPRAGPAPRGGERTSEEIDVVGRRRGRVTVVGECKWTSGPMTAKVLDDLERFKLPALRQDGLRVASPVRQILLFSKSGFKPNLTDACRRARRHPLGRVGRAGPRARYIDTTVRPVCFSGPGRSTPRAHRAGRCDRRSPSGRGRSTRG